MLYTPLHFTMSTQHYFPLPLPFYRISVQERECDYRDSRTNMFDHFETYDFNQIAATPKNMLEHSTVSPFVRSYPVMRIFIIPNRSIAVPNEVADQAFPLRITMTMMYVDKHPEHDAIPDPDLDVVRKLCGLSNPQFCVSDLSGKIIHIFQALSGLNDYLSQRSFPAITATSVEYTSGLALIYKEISLAPVMEQMVNWICNIVMNSKENIICNMNQLVYTKIHADATSMGLWIDNVVYALHLCIKKTKRLELLLDTMIDLFDDEDNIEILDESKMLNDEYENDDTNICECVN